MDLIIFMSYFEKTRILAVDSPSIDAFGKCRVSNPTTLFDNKQIVDSGRWDLLINPSVINSLTWGNVTGSVVTQMARSNVGNPITNMGTTIATGYFAGTGGQEVSNMIVLDPYYGLGRKIDGTSDILAVGIKTLNNIYTVYPSLIVRELT